MSIPPKNPPIMYDYQNLYNSQVEPGTIHCSDNTLRMYFARYLTQKALSVFEWTMPETWASNYFLYNLFLRGFVAVINTDKFGVIPQQCGLYGFNVMYQPTHATIANPLLRGNLRPQIDKECTVLRLCPDYGGIYDLVMYYADLMACASQTTTVNLINTKFSYVFFADGKAQAETFKKLFDRFSSGEPATVIDKQLLDENGNPRWQLFTQNIQQAYIADKNLEVLKRIDEMFNREIGIPETNEDKKERLLTDEVNTNIIESLSKADMWLKELQKGCEKTRKMFGIDIDVKWRKLDQSVLYPIKKDNMVGD